MTMLLGWNIPRRLALMTLLLMVPLAHVQAQVSKEDQQAIDALIAASRARAAIIRNVSPAVVHINVEKTVKNGEGESEGEPFGEDLFRRFFPPRFQPPREFRQRGLGSGSIVDKRGYILTNNHVIEGADKITVQLKDGRELEAKLVGADPKSDLAVLKIEADDLPLARLGNSDKVEVGETVIAIGNPFGFDQTVTQGIVSAIGRSSVGLTDYEDFIQTDASINPGNSGGPLINLNGEIIAVNTAIFSRSGGNMGIGFAIPINMARSVMTSLIEKGRVVRGFLGVIIQDVTQELADAMNVEVNAGVLISSVGKDTPAGKAGIREGDIVTHFNKRRVRSSNALRNTVAGVLPGKEVPVRLIREGKTMDVTVTLVEQPDDMQAAIREGKEGKGENGTEKVSPEDALGLELQPLTPDLASRLGYRGLSGVVVTDVAQGSPAFEAGLREGALIEAVNRVPVANIKAFRAQLAKVASGKSILLLARLNESKRFIVIKKP